MLFVIPHCTLKSAIMSICMRNYKWEVKLIARCRPETRMLLFELATSELIQYIVGVARVGQSTIIEIR